MNNWNLNQILFYILIVELTKFEKINKSRLNILSISIFGEIRNEVTKKLLIIHLMRLLHSKITELDTIVIVKINKELSERLNPKLVGKELRFSLTINQTEIIINEIIEVGRTKNYLNRPLFLLP